MVKQIFDVFYILGDSLVNRHVCVFVPESPDLSIAAQSATGLGFTSGMIHMIPW